VAVLKGARTVVVSPAGRCTVNSTGNPAMASGGMGDALTGLLTALLAQGVAPADAALAGVWLHGHAADLAACGADAGLLASDVIDRLPQARADLRC
jgi:NAD(P)H-hydrate epimerase